MFQPDDPASELYVIPDARIVESRVRTPDPQSAAGRGGAAVAEAVIATPIDVTGLLPNQARERFLEIRDTANREVVTIIEIVSPSNKTPGSAGRRSFQQKRHEVGGSDTSWLEIDLLRDGTPTWSAPSVPRSAYRAYADRTMSEGRRQLAWPILLRERLPVLSVPFRADEKDAALDVQAALDGAYDAAGYDLDVDYARPPVPPLDAEGSAWVDSLLRARGLRN